MEKVKHCIVFGAEKMFSILFSNELTGNVQEKISETPKEEPWKKFFFWTGGEGDDGIFDDQDNSFYLHEVEITAIIDHSLSPFDPPNNFYDDYLKDWKEAIVTPETLSLDGVTWEEVKAEITEPHRPVQ